MRRKTFSLTFFALMLALAGSAGAGLHDKGTILFEWFNGTTGGNLDQAVDGRNANYPDNPSQVEYRTVLQGPTSRGDNYMTHVRGYLYPPETGEYTFWTSSDDHSRLWLSTDADPANKTLIAEVSGSTSALQWDKFPTQKSSLITLQAGQKYYIEVLHRDGTGGDNLAVGWGGPGIGAGPVVIDGAFLSPFIRAVDYLAGSPDPANGAIYANVWATLGWSAGLDAVSHDVYFSNDSNAVTTGAAGAFAGNVTTNLFLVGLGLPGDPYPGGLALGTTYYWRVDEIEADGTTKHQGRVWSFFVPTREAYQPFPIEGSKYQDTGITLTWVAGMNAKIHTVYLGDSFEAVSNATTGGTSQALTNYTPASLLENGRTYYWRVDEMDPPTTTKGNVWSFTTLPAITIADPNLIGWWKLDEGEGTRAVDWSGHGNHGELRGDPQWVNGYDGGALDFDGSGDFIFTGKNASALGIEANKPRTVTAWVYTRAFNNGGIFDMGNRAAGQDFCLRTLGTVNQWRIQYWSGDFDFTYPSQNVWVHFAHVHDGLRTRTYANGVLIVDWDKTINTADTNPFQIGAYGWQANFFNGLIDDVRLFNKFLTAEEIQVVMLGDPMRAGNPSPPNRSSADIVRAAILSWLPGSAAAQHAVYFGTDMAAVADANTSDTTGIYRGFQTSASYTLPEALAWASGPYYWRVDEQNIDGTVIKGTLWSFSVPDYILIDDFEAYNDTSSGQAGSNLVYETWLDGYGTTTNGSAMGYTVPFAPTMETGVVHSGRQSAPMTYNNTTAAFSEVTCTFAVENWTNHGIQTLSLWFYGDPNNVPGQLYVKVNGAKATYDGEAVNLTLQRWQTFNIDLASVGVNLQSVTSLAVGIEGAGAKGTMLLDDIRLYPYARQLITPVQPDPNGLTAHYPLDGNANDIAGTNNGTLSGGPLFTAGQIDQAIQFDGVDDYVDCGTGASLDIQDAITLSCWIKVAAFTKNWEAILAKGDNSYRMSRSATTGNSVHFGCNGPTGGNLNATAIMTDDNWHHVACVYDGVNKLIYIDGREDARVASTGQINVSTNPLWIGNNSGSTARQLGGLVDDVRIYSRALSDAEVAGLAGRTLPHDKPF